jgi:hypothetical protein
MIDLQTVLEMWEKDSLIDQTHLDQSSVEIVKVHSKYLRFLALSKLQRKKQEMSQNILLKNKWLYYNGKMTAIEMDKRGWDYDPFDGLKVLKGDMDHYYNSDIDIQKTEEKATYHKILVETLQEIIDTLRWRQQHIKNIIEWKKFESGG